jgi:hypothetical protein
LKDKKLNIQAKKVFHIVEEGLKTVNGGNDSLEPVKSGSIEPKSELSLSTIQSWWTTVEDVRTFYVNTINQKVN